jgi:hypothetical protein
MPVPQVAELELRQLRLRCASASCRPAGPRSEKWIRFSALNDAPAQRRSIGFDPESGSAFGSEALDDAQPRASGSVPEAELDPVSIRRPFDKPIAKPLRQCARLLKVGA